MWLSKKVGVLTLISAGLFYSSPVQAQFRPRANAPGFLTTFGGSPTPGFHRPGDGFGLFRGTVPMQSQAIANASFGGSPTPGFHRPGDGFGLFRGTMPVQSSQTLANASFGNPAAINALQSRNMQPFGIFRTPGSGFGFPFTNMNPYGSMPAMMMSPYAMQGYAGAMPYGNGGNGQYQENDYSRGNGDYGMPGQASAMYSSTAPSSATPKNEFEPKSAADIEISDASLSPDTITVQPGSIVRWINRGQSKHSLTSTPTLWHSGDLAPGESFTYRFSYPGVYSYTFDGQTSTAKGKVVVR